MAKDYSITAWTDGFGIWHAKASFHTGLGNSGEAEAIKMNALRNCKRTIRREIVSRETQPVKGLQYEISENKIDNMNRMWSITVREGSERDLPCDHCGTMIEAGVHREELGMCLGCSDDYWGHKGKWSDD
jgi:hypothetical protein